jgi:hypothetical protein
LSLGKPRAASVTSYREKEEEEEAADTVTLEQGERICFLLISSQKRRRRAGRLGRKGAVTQPVSNSKHFEGN